MFIELTDHLRCPADHPESYLVLLPDRMRGRHVDAGSLGCPTCGRVVPIAEGVADFGENALPPSPTALTPPAIAAMLGLEGPGGYVAVFGAAGGDAAALAELLPGIRLVLVNPPVGTQPNEAASVLRAGRSPLKSRCLRGVVISADHAAAPAWVEEGLAAVLPGLRAVVEGPSVARADLTLLAQTSTVWVARVGR